MNVASDLVFNEKYLNKTKICGSYEFLLEYYIERLEPHLEKEKKGFDMNDE